MVEGANNKQGLVSITITSAIDMYHEDNMKLI